MSEAKVYDPIKAEWVAPKAADRFRVAEHEAMVEGKPPPQSDDSLAAMPAPVRSNALGQTDVTAVAEPTERGGKRER